MKTRIDIFYPLWYNNRMDEIIAKDTVLRRAFAERKFFTSYVKKTGKKYQTVQDGGFFDPLFYCSGSGDRDLYSLYHG